MTSLSLRCTTLVLCETVLQDSATGLLTLVNCLESIAATRLPAVHPKFAFAAFIRSDTPAQEDHDIEVRFVRIEPGGEEHVTWQLAAMWTAGARVVRAYQNFAGVRLDQAGVLRFRFDWRLSGGDWQSSPSAPLEILTMPSPAGDVEPPHTP